MSTLEQETHVAAGAAAANGSGAPGVSGGAPSLALADQVAGIPVLKGLVLYGATIAFACFYGYFIDRIVTAATGVPPSLNVALVGAAAALAGILGSAFALVVGTSSQAPNEALAADLRAHAALRSLGTRPPRGDVVRVWLRKALSLEPGARSASSWPLTFGIWTYAAVAGAVAVTYFLYQAETPDAVKALALVFAGYVVSLMTAAYGIASRK
jgi:hypothetical protein